MSYQQLLCFWHQHQDAITKFVFALAAPGGIWFWIDKFEIASEFAFAMYA